MSEVEHALIAETGTEAGSRYVVMAGVHVDDPAEVASRLTDASDERVVDLLRTLALDIRIAFASKQKVEELGEDWRLALLRSAVSGGFNPGRIKQFGYPVVAYLPEGLPFDFEWLDAYLTNSTFGGVLFRSKVLAADHPLLLLPRLVARRFHAAVEDDRGRPTAARDRYQAIAPLIKGLEDVGLEITYGPRATGPDGIVRVAQSS